LLLIFSAGLESPSLVVPNGGSEAVDDVLVKWLRRLLNGEVQGENREAVESQTRNAA
jgi:hypothetical protein